MGQFYQTFFVPFLRHDHITMVHYNMIHQLIGLPKTKKNILDMISFLKKKDKVKSKNT